MPDGYKVTSRTFDDIKYVLRPTFTKELVSQLDDDTAKTVISYDLNNKPYLPGKLNNIGELYMG